MPILTAEPRAFPDDLLCDGANDQGERLWRVVHTKSRQEKSLARDLRKYRVPHYLPLVVTPHVYRGKRVNSYSPLFGGYVFLYCTEEERIRTFGTGRVAQLLPVEDQDGLLSDLQSVEQLINAGVPLTVESRLRPGQRVRVKSGSLVGMEGIVEARRATCKLVVIIEFLQQGVSLEIDDYLLEPA